MAVWGGCKHKWQVKRQDSSSTYYECSNCGASKLVSTRGK